MSRLLLFSSDCHAGLPTADYGLYLEEPYREGLEEYVVEMKRRSESLSGRLGSASDAFRQDYERRAVFAAHLDQRVAALEADGFVGEILFPDGTFDNEIPFTGNFGGISSYPADVHAAALRAYNRWLSENLVPDRQIGIGLVSVLDAEYATEQVKGFRALGLNGMMPELDGLDHAFPSLYDSRLDPMWAACASDGLVVNFHAGIGIPVDAYTGEGIADTLVGACEMHFWSRRPLWHMILGGVLERHPNLKVGMVECFADWIPRTLEYLDWVWESFAGGPKNPVCPKSPSEYWARQCFVSAHAASLGEQNLRHEFAPGTFTYATDFPHQGSPWGVSNEFLQATMGPAGVSEAEARAILGESIVKIYDLDMAPLQAIADRVGPEPAEVLAVPAGTDPTAKMTPYLKGKVGRPYSML